MLEKWMALYFFSSIRYSTNGWSCFIPCFLFLSKQYSGYWRNRKETSSLRSIVCIPRIECENSPDELSKKTRVNLSIISPRCLQRIPCGLFFFFSLSYYFDGILIGNSKIGRWGEKQNVLCHCELEIKGYFFRQTCVMRRDSWSIDVIKKHNDDKMIIFRFQ